MIYEKNFLLDTGGYGIGRAPISLKKYYISNKATQLLQSLGYNLAFNKDSLTISNAHIVGFKQVNSRLFNMLNDWNCRYNPIGINGSFLKLKDNYFAVLAPLELGTEFEIYLWTLKEGVTNE